MLRKTSDVACSKTIYSEDLCFSDLKSSFDLHEEWEITLIIGGSGVFITGNSMISYKSGDLLVIGSNITHSFVCSGPEPFIARSLKISPDMMWGLLEIPEMADFKNFFALYRHGCLFKDIISDELTMKFIESQTASGANLVFCLFQIIQLILASTGSQPVTFEKNKFLSFDSERLKKIHRYVNENIGKNITLNQIAEIANLTPTAFCRFFKQQTGTHFISFLNDIRIKSACRYITTKRGNCSVAELAFNFGFSSVKSFNRVFKVIKGMPPGKFLELALKELN